MVTGYGDSYFKLICYLAHAACLPRGLYISLALIIPPPTRSVKGGIYFTTEIFLSPPNVRGRSTDRQPL